MRRITARYGEGWLPATLNVGEYAQRLSLIKEECERVGRNFQEIKKDVYLHIIVLSETKSVWNANTQFSSHKLHGG